MESLSRTRTCRLLGDQEVQLLHTLQNPPKVVSVCLRLDGLRMGCVAVYPVLVAALR
jgi:hypothetical protein